MSDPAHDQVILGRYRVVRRLTQGGMGVVYLGRVEGDAGFAKAVVIKRILQDIEDEEQNTAQFIREAQILSHLQHPGIVGVLDFGRTGGGYSMVLEYVHGYDLARWLKYLNASSQRMHWEEAVLIGIRVLEALHYAHTFRMSDGAAACVLHRDISPGNILLDLEGRVRLLDFGIARMAHGDVGEYKTQTGVLKGKMGFLAPELFGMAPATTSSDLYACGVVLYQMLAGEHPFASADQRQLMYRAVSEDAKHLAKHCPDIPPALDAAVLRALAKQPEDRHASAEEFARSLRKTLIRSEAEVLAALRERLHRDFNGEMPSTLKLEPLQERDRAWREDKSSRRLEVPPLSSSLAPVNSQPTVGPPRRRGAQPQSERGELTEGDLTLTNEARASAVSRKTRLLLGVGIGAALMAVMAGALLLLLSREPASAPAAARFIVVESPEKKARAAEPVTATATEPPASAPVELAPAANDAAKPQPARNVKPARETGASALSRHFARRQSALEACFQRYAAELQGRPEISVIFEVATSGRVSSATLSPAAINGTPLGECLLSVARTTDFGPQPKPVSFSIPLLARVVEK